MPGITLVGVPSVSKSADYALNRALSAAGLSLDSVKRETVGPGLAATLAASKPSLIVALGQEAGEFLLADSWPVGEESRDIRGFLWDTRYGRVLTAMKPEDVVKDWTPWRALMDVDFRRAAAEWHAGCQPLTTRAVTICTSSSDVEELDDTIRRTRWTANDVDSVVRRTSWVAVDIENHSNLSLACVGFAPTEARAWVIPAYEAWQVAAIKRLVEDPLVPKVLQNGQYDRAFLRWNSGMNLTNQVFDTQLGWHALQPELAGKKTATKRRVSQRRTVKSLNFLASIYTRDPFWKQYAFQNENDRYVLCGRDCCVTLEIAHKQARQLEAV